MITIDDRVGAVELERPMRGFGLPTRIRRLDFADIAFTGYGPNDSLARVGIERKVLSDLVSSLQSGRLVGHQLPGLLQTYTHVYLLVEGIWRPDPKTGLVIVPRAKGWVAQGFGNRRLLYADLQSWLNTLAVQAGVRLLRTASLTESCWVLAGLYKWWDKPWEKHTSLLPVLKGLERQGTADSDSTVFTLRKVPVLQKMLAQFTSLGWERSKAAADHFGQGRSLREALKALADAGEKDWQQVPGIGPVIAAKTVKELRR